MRLLGKSVVQLNDWWKISQEQWVLDMTTLDWQFVQTKIAHEIKTRILCSTMWKNIVVSDRPWVQIWCKRFSCWRYKATGTHTENTWILTALLWQQWLWNAPQYYVIRTFPDLLNVSMIKSDGIPRSQVKGSHLFCIRETKMPTGDTKLLPTIYTRFTVRRVCFTVSRLITS
jgi:hypothetical protein